MAKQYEMSITAWRSVTITASSEDEARELAAGYAGDWEIGDWEIEGIDVDGVTEEEED